MRSEESLRDYIPDGVTHYSLLTTNPSLLIRHHHIKIYKSACRG